MRVEALAKALGVSKGGFYGHFPDRRALLEQTLDAWERTSTEAVIAWVEDRGGDPRTRLRRLFALASASDDRDALRTDLAVRDWAQRDPAVAARLRRVDNRRIEYMRSLFGGFCADEADVEARCLLAASLWLGNHFLAAQHGSRSRTEVLELALARLEA